MRLLYLSRADEFRDKSSLVIIAKSVFRHMLEDDPEMFVQWVVPRGTKPEVLDEYVLAPLGENAKRMAFLPTLAGLSGRSLGYFLTEDLWYAATQTKVQIPYDVVLSNQLAMTPIWKTVLTNRYQASRYAVDTPIVNWQMWTATTQQLREVPEYYAGEADVVAESVSSMFAHNVWESEVLYKAHLDTMRQYVQPHVLKAVMAQSEVIANGVDWPALDKVYRHRVAHVGSRTVNLFWGGRLANQKKPRVTFPIMEAVRTIVRAGPPIVSTNRPESDPDVEWVRDTFPDWALHTGVDRTAFFGLMAQGDVFLCNSPSESYGVAWLEMLAVGMLGVFEKAWWNETLLPDWYPFVAEDSGQQKEMAVALMQDWPDGPLWREYVPRVRAWIEEEHNEQLAGQRLGATLRRVKAQSLVDGRDGGAVGDLAAEACLAVWRDLGEEWAAPADDVWERMRGMSESGREWGKPGDLVSPMFLRRCLEVRGWRDTCSGPKVAFVPATPSTHP